VETSTAVYFSIYIIAIPPDGGQQKWLKQAVEDNEGIGFIKVLCSF
jgi:hypothetical protein